jgi:hypothetical protein
LTKFLKPFSKADFKHKTIYMHYDEKSLADRRERATGTAVFHQLQQMKLLTRWPLSMPTKKRKHYDGSNKGDLMGPVHLADWSSSWSGTYDEKLEVYGRTHRIAVGGATDEDDNEDDDPDAMCDGGDQPKTFDRHTTDGKEPMFYHGLPQTFYEDLFTSYCIRHVIHLTAGDGSAAKAAMTLRRGYLGVCMTEEHLDKLYIHLTSWMLEQMSDANSPYYQSDMKNVDDASSKKDDDAKKNSAPKEKKPKKDDGSKEKKTKKDKKPKKDDGSKEKKPKSASSGSSSSDSGNSK